MRLIYERRPDLNDHAQIASVKEALEGGWPRVGAVPTLGVVVEAGVF